MQLANETVGPLISTDHFTPSTTIRAINVLWFSSLLLSIFSALFGIFVKQWLHAYSNWSDISNAANAVRVRTLYRQSLKKWAVPHIVAMLPLLLQFALLFFVVGLLGYLWTLNTIVAGFATGLAMIGVIAAVVVIILPVYSDECLYRSPIGFALVRLIRGSLYSSWTERDVAIMQSSLPRDSGRVPKQTYLDACALLDIHPASAGTIPEAFVKSQVQDLDLHTNWSSFALLECLLSLYANSVPQQVEVSVTGFIRKVLEGVQGSPNCALTGETAYGFAYHIASATTTRQTRIGDIAANIRLLEAFAKRITSDLSSKNDLRVITGSRRLLAHIQNQIREANQQGLPTESTKQRWNSLNQLLQKSTSLLNTASLVGHNNSLTFLPGGSYILFRSNRGLFEIWDSSPLTPRYWYSRRIKSGAALALSRDGTHIAVGAAGGRGRLMAAMMPNRSITRMNNMSPVWTMWSDTSNNPRADMSIAFSPDGAVIAVSSEDGSISVIGAATNRMAVSRTFEGVGQCVAYSPNEARLAVARGDQVDVLNVTDLEVVWSFTKHTASVNSIAYSPGGTQIASASSDSTVRLCDASVGTEQLRYSEHSGKVYSAVFTSNGARVVSGSADKTVHVWSALTGETVWKFTDPSNSVRAVAVSPDGLLIAAATEGDAILGWATPL